MTDLPTNNPKKVRKTGKDMPGITGSILVIYHHLDYMARLSVRLSAISARLLVRLLAILARLLAILLVILLVILLARLLTIGRVNYWPRRPLARLLARLSSPSFLALLLLARLLAILAPPLLAPP